MTEKNTYALLEQIHNIILNEPVQTELAEKKQAASDLQNAISYLSHCLMESNEFLKNLAKGNLEVPLPDSHNFLAGELIKFHASLKHLSWQTNQVIKFNEMVEQLEKREKELKDEAEKNRQFNKLLVSIMNSLKEWVVVTEEETGEILYTNELAKKRFFDFRTGRYACGKECPLMSRLKSYAGLEHELRYEFKCFHNRIFQVKSYSLLWEDKKAVVHLITDITYQRENEAFLEVMAYKDELTGLDNRRSCLRTIDAYIQKEIPFSICMIDLDGLKSINDQFGHLSGDEYIKFVSEALKEIAGKGNFTCRFGGDEFVVLFPYCDEQTAKKKMAVIDQKMSDSKKGYPMSVSYGVVYIMEGTHMSPEAAFNAADEKMYRFKRRRKRKKNPEGSSRI